MYEFVGRVRKYEVARQRSILQEIITSGNIIFLTGFLGRRIIASGGDNYEMANNENSASGWP